MSQDHGVCPVALNFGNMTDACAASMVVMSLTGGTAKGQDDTDGGLGHITATGVGCWE